MRLLEHFVAAPSPCAYLPAETASLEYRIQLDVSPAELEAMLARGWRRFGPAYFRPRCAACSACVPLRIPVETFTPSRGQRRVLRAGADVALAIGPPLVDVARLALYRAWHGAQGEKRGWTEDSMTPTRYLQEFAFPHPAVREFAYRVGDRLVAVGLVDETPNALSAIYTYHDPALASRSLGTLSVLRQIAVARALGKRHLYLGFRVLGCRSSEYKAKFCPHELLHGLPGPGDSPDWRPASAA